MPWLNAFKKLFQKHELGPAARVHTVIVVSDLHMGEEVGEGKTPFMDLITRLNQNFGAFIDYQRQQHRSPMTLVINGDSIDFLRTTLHPNPIEARLLHTQALTPREARLGRDSSRTNAAWKLSRIAGFHKPVFAALARFVEDGNTLVFVRGNHDVELYWPEVRSSIVDAIIDQSSSKSAKLAERIKFEPWFYYLRGLLWIEHGHQYDPHCSYQDLLDPVEDEGRMLAMPYTQWSIRYFAPLLHGMPAAEMENWSFLDFLRFAFKQSPRNFLSALTSYVHMSVDVLVRRSWRHTVGRTRTRERHARRLESLAAESGIALKLIERIDALKEKPVQERFLGMTLAFYVDRLLLLLLACAFIGAAILLPLPSLWRLVLIAGTLGATLVAHRLLQHIRSRDAQPHLAEKAWVLGHLLRVPYIVFGHSHEACIKPHPVDSVDETVRHFYLNSGHWVARYPQTAMTFIEIKHSAGKHSARLLRWQGSQLEPAEIATADTATVDPTQVGDDVADTPKSAENATTAEKQDHRAEISATHKKS